MKLKLIQFDVILLCFTFYEITMLPHTAFLGYKYAVLTYIFLRYILTANKMPYMIIPAAAYGAISVISSVYNHMTPNQIVASVFFAVQILDIFLLTENFLSKYSLEEFASTVLAVFGFLIAATDALMLVRRYNFNDPNEKYLIGNKFVVSYVHCFASALMFMLSSRTQKVWTINQGVLRVNGLSMRLAAFGMTIFSVFICRKVTCSTGMLCCILLIIMMLVPVAVRRFFASGKTMIIITTVLNFMLLGSYSILNSTFMHDFIYGTLDKSTTWNGRLVIWKEIFKLIGKKPLLGYGYYSSVVAKKLGFGNPQNAVLKFMIDSGILGLAAFGVLVWVSFRLIKNQRLTKLYPMAAFMYTMIFASLVEINLTHMIVFMAMAIAYSGTKYTPGRIVNENRNTLNATSS